MSLRKTPVKFLVRADPKPKPVIIVTPGDGPIFLGNANRPCAFIGAQPFQLQARDAPDYPKISEMPSGPFGVSLGRGRDTTARNRLYRARSLFAPQRFVIQYQEILRFLRMPGVQFVEQRSQCGTRRGITKNGVPAVSRKFTGAQRGNILHKLAAGFRRQFGNGFLNFQQ